MGYLSQVQNASTHAAYWQADVMNAEGRLTQFTQLNGVATTQTFDPQTGRVTASDIVDGPQKTFAYDSIGNITSKDGVGSYTYPAATTSRPHAVSSIAGTVNGVVNPTFTYDANGNLLSGAGRALTWTSFNMAATIQQGSTTLTFTYDSEHRRITQTGPAGTTRYFDDPASGLHVEALSGSGGGTQWSNYIYAAGGMVAVFYQHTGYAPPAPADTTRYFHKDHLGSIAVVTDETGTVVDRNAFDVWGKRRDPNGADDPTNALYTSGLATDRGFTGHEELLEVTLVHMNGRIYDPAIGRFMSADPQVQDPLDTQNLNRYSYVLNNPLAFTDPNGFGFFSWVKHLFSPVVKIFEVLGRSQIGQAIEEIGAFFGCGGGPQGAGCVAAVSAINTGINGGSLGEAIKNAGITFATAYGLSQASGITDPFTRVAASAAVGGVSSVASGGSFQTGALTAGIVSAVGPNLPDIGKVAITVTVHLIDRRSPPMQDGAWPVSPASSFPACRIT